MRTLAFLAAVMMMVMVLLPVASAENGWGDDDAYFITITAAEGTYNIGDEVTVTVHVFDAGEYAEVDNVTLMVGSIFTTREVQVEEGATGRWAGTFTIEEDDVLFAYVYLSAEAFIEGISVEDGMGMVYLEETAIMEDPLVITQTVSPPGVYMSIGDTKKVTWKITHKGTPVDPEFIELQLDEDGNSQEVQPSKMSTGVYEYTYTMASTPRSMRVSFELWAEYDTGTETIEGSNDVSLILNHLHVWAKKVAVSATSASFEVYVANLTGSAVEAAAINVNYFYHDEDGDPVSKKSNGTTDTSGRALIDFAYNDLGTEQYEVDMEGKVTAQGKEQTVEFTLAVRAEPGDEPDVPEDDGFDVIAGKDIFDFDKTANLPATAYFDGETMNAAEVYWYAVSPNAVINKGTKTTAVDGTFSVDFRTPKKGDASYKIVTTYFETPVEDGSTMYYGDEETIMVSSVNIDDTPDSFIDAIGMKGTYVPVTISYSGADETWVCAIMLSNDPSPGNLERVPGWTYWTESPIEGMYGDMAQYDGSKFTGDIFIPETMPNKGHHGLRPVDKDKVC